MERKDPDLRAIFILFVAITFLLFVYQAYLLFFTPQRQAPQEKVEEKPQDVPSLLLGTTREERKPQRLRTFDFEKFTLTLSEEGARVVSLVDKKYAKELITEEEKRLGIYPLELFTGDPEKDLALNFSPYEIEQRGNKVVAKLSGEGFSVVKTLEYMGDHFRLKVETESLPTPFVSTGLRVQEEEFFTHSGPVLKVGDDLQRLEVKKGRELVTGDIKFAGEESRYYFKGFSGRISAVVVYKVEDKHTLSLVKPVGEVVFYAGAKEYARLRALGLSDTIDFGSLRLIVKPLFVFMYWIYEHLNSWFFSILALTFLVRILVFPLTYKSTVAMSKMAELAPRMQELKEKYKNNPAKFQEEMMKLYQEVGFNPMSGCLPLLLQIPIFFALYKVLTITADLQLARFLWVESLALKDPYYVLPVLMGLTMVAQQFISPSPDKSQNYIMIITSVVFTLLFANFPAGLVLYWTLNNIFNLGQTYLIKKLTQKSSPQKERKKGKK
ncbi:MAG: membrane protein insertase YidC [Aquificaceae bacterium]|nr:membrane protein insertase YidC [Aquificaceae bacterium]MCX8060922.1 membrane protein insertase YidC [Aquificaceae bacterium]MDW8097015.1 membrane protein insertase YidC [Aquificaceae bacterium]